MQFTHKGIHLFRPLISIAFAGALAVCSLPVFAGDLSHASALFEQAQYKASIALLDAQKEAHQTGAAALGLLGRDYYMLGDFKKASSYLEKAAAAEPGNSDYADWLGRSYGKRAEVSNFLSAPRLALKARQAFERAVRLDPKNADALSDLFDYYLEAPGFLGGGYDKAAGVAEKMSAVDPAEGYFEQAELAQKQDQLQLAENRLRKSVELGPKEPGHLVALGKLLAREGLADQSDAAFRKAQQAAPNSPEVWFAFANTLIKEKRNPKEAKALLEKYVNAPVTANDPLRQEAFNLLKQVNGA